MREALQRVDDDEIPFRTLETLGQCVDAPGGGRSVSVVNVGPPFRCCHRRSSDTHRRGLRPLQACGVEKIGLAAAAPPFLG